MQTEGSRNARGTVRCRDALQIFSGSLGRQEGEERYETRKGRIRGKSIRVSGPSTLAPNLNEHMKCSGSGVLPDPGTVADISMHTLRREGIWQLS